MPFFFPFAPYLHIPCLRKRQILVLELGALGDDWVSEVGGPWEEVLGVVGEREGGEVGVGGSSKGASSIV